MNAFGLDTKEPLELVSAGFKPFNVVRCGFSDLHSAIGDLPFVGVSEANQWQSLVIDRFRFGLALMFNK